VPLETVSGEEEGRLAFAGATARQPPGLAPFVTVDLGGGSTEFAVGTSSCEAVVSAPFGATMLTERYLPSDPPRPEELVAALSIAEAHLDDVARAVPAIPEAMTFLGLGGTFTTIAAVEIGLAQYDRSRVNGFRLDRAAAEDVYRTLVTERLADRLQNPGLPPERGGTIVGGACAVVAIMRYFGLDAVVISDNDLLDGLIGDLAASA
jgi:exopolyphosphatase/guanosine-5'-triphosphate,3'-diphosphate pyrophosphatase